jgi:hypothetical protein
LKIPELKHPDEQAVDVESLVLLGGLGDLCERIFRKSGESPTYSE